MQGWRMPDLRFIFVLAAIGLAVLAIGGVVAIVGVVWFVVEHVRVVW